MSPYSALETPGFRIDSNAGIRGRTGAGSFLPLIIVLIGVLTGDFLNFRLIHPESSKHP